MKSICLLSSLIIALYILCPVQSGTVDMNLKLYKNEVLYANQIYFYTDRICKLFIKKTPWSESASELYRPSDRRLSAK
jgi:hypothetical protein